MTKKLINVKVTDNRMEYVEVAIPADINEIELKACLRDLGYISSYQRSYLTTKVYLENDDKKEQDEEICIDKYRSLGELGIEKNSRIVIVKGEPEPEPQYEDDYPDFMSMRFLYGCPMARSVEEAINQAEKYTDDDSYVTTGHINFD